MGYSCTQKADDTLRRITAACLKQTGSQNTYRAGAREYMLEIGRENDDGAITGDLYELRGDTIVGSAGDFRIEPDGTLTRGRGLKQLIAP